MFHNGSRNLSYRLLRVSIDTGLDELRSYPNKLISIQRTVKGVLNCASTVLDDVTLSSSHQSCHQNTMNNSQKSTTSL